MSAARRPVYFNPSARSWTTTRAASSEDDLVDRFHRQLPEYEPTNLVSLGHVATDIGVQAVYLKDESSRLGLPSFKILGASWGTFRAIAQRLQLPLDTSLAAMKDALQISPVKLYASTDGNHGRAVARMAALLGVAAEIHVPSEMHPATIDFIKTEGAMVVVSAGNYDASVEDAKEAAQRDSMGVLVQDYAFGDYLEIPQVCLYASLTSSK